MSFVFYERPKNKKSDASRKYVMPCYMYKQEVKPQMSDHTAETDFTNLVPNEETLGTDNTIACTHGAVFLVHHNDFWNTHHIKQTAFKV